ncbi:POTRA domain-containing protein [Komagataeibacter rhaeticus]|nr:POTRA domain-containing protein [Komagataeibacter rhaeticus]
MRHPRRAGATSARAGRSAGYASLCVILTAFVPWAAARAADPQEYVTTLRPTGNADLDSALRASSDLLSLQKTQAVSPFALTGRIHNDYSRLISALESYGYYAGGITITVTDVDPKAGAAKGADTGHDGRDPDLPEWLQSIPAGRRAQITISAAPGSVFRIGVVTLQPDKGDPPVRLNADEAKAFALGHGAPAQADNVLAAGAALQVALTEEGYALAHVGTPQAWLRPDTHTLDLAYTVHRGPVVNLGAFDFAGLQRTHPAYVARRMTIAPGELCQPSRIERARQDIAATGLFSDVQVTHGDTLASDGTMPLAFGFREGKRHSVGAEGGYSTDLGGRAGVTWTHNNLFGNAERLRLTALITGLGGSAEQGLGYDFYADLMKPDFGSREQNLSARLEGIKQELYSYRQTALLARIGVVRHVNRLWNVSFGGEIEQEQIQQMRATNSYFIVSLPLTANYEGTGVDNPITPATHGVRVGPASRHRPH